MSDETKTLEYAAPENDPPNVDGLLRAAYWLNWIGIVSPLAGLGGAAWAWFAMIQPFVDKQDKETAQRLLVAGVVVTIINATVLISFILSFAYTASIRRY